MSKTLTSLKQYLSNLYTSPSQAVQTRSEIRQIVSNYTFTSNVSDMFYEDLDSAAAIGSN